MKKIHVYFSGISQFRNNKHYEYFNLRSLLHTNHLQYRKAQEIHFLSYVHQEYNNISSVVLQSGV